MQRLFGCVREIQQTLGELYFAWTMESEVWNLVRPEGKDRVAISRRTLWMMRVCVAIFP